MYEFFLQGWHDYFNPLMSFLQQQGAPCEVRWAKSIPVARRWWKTKAWRIPGLVIRHRRSGDFAVLDTEDFAPPSWSKSKIVLRDPHCRVYLKAQFCPKLCARPPYDRIRPWTYGVYDALEMEKHVDRLRQVKRLTSRLFFRGKEDHSNRSEILTCLRGMGLVEPSLDRVPIPAYLEELSRHRLALSLPGHGNLCHREIEAFGIGTPVLMPRHKNVLHEPLIPDHHYFSVDADPETHDPQVVARRIRARYDQVAGDVDALERVARNAIAWYDRNVRQPASLELTGRLLGLLPAGPDAGTPFPGIPRPPASPLGAFQKRLVFTGLS